MNASALRASSRILNRMSGGSVESEAKELMVIPSRLPSPDKVVTKHTPVGKAANDCRNERASTVTGVSPVMSVQEYMNQFPASGINTGPSASGPAGAAPP